MFPRRRVQRATQVRMPLPFGRQMEVTIPRAPWSPPPPRSRWAGRRGIAVAVAALGAALAYLTSLARKRGGPSTDEHLTTVRTGADTATAQPTVTPAVQRPTSDREPDELDRLARLDPTQAGSRNR